VNGAHTPRLVTQTHGMGVDSAAWLAGVLLGELPAPFNVADLTVVTAMVGDESQATRHAMQTHMLPLMAAHGVRYVQVARASPTTTTTASWCCPTPAHPTRLAPRTRTRW
jgi:hypothetical protein